MTHWKNLANYDYLGSYSLEGLVSEIVLTIKDVKKERVTTNGGNSEDCIVIYFQEANKNNVVVKPMVLNKTNCKTVASLYGDYIEGWINKKIKIFSTTTKFQREIVPCLRVKKEIPQDESEETTQEYKCIICGKELTAAFHQKSVERYGVALCSKACLEKYQEENNKINNEEKKVEEDK